jgi:hypothetical protein
MHLDAVPYSRREMIQCLGGGLGALALTSLLAPRAECEGPPHGPHFRPRAKRQPDLQAAGRLLGQISDISCQNGSPPTADWLSMTLSYMSCIRVT